MDAGTDKAGVFGFASLVLIAVVVPVLIAAGDVAESFRREAAEVGTVLVRRSLLRILQTCNLASTWIKVINCLISEFYTREYEFVTTKNSNGFILVEVIKNILSAICR